MTKCDIYIDITVYRYKSNTDGPAGDHIVTLASPMMWLAEAFGEIGNSFYHPLILVLTVAISVAISVAILVAI